MFWEALWEESTAVGSGELPKQDPESSRHRNDKRFISVVIPLLAPLEGLARPSSRLHPQPNKKFFGTKSMKYRFLDA
jgi:hypothetical protein